MDRPASHLAEAGRDVGAIYWAKNGDFTSSTVISRVFLDGVLSDAQALELKVGSGGGFVAASGWPREPAAVDAVINACHGGPGEDGTLQALFDLAGVRYTGPSRSGAAMMDKLAFGALLDSRGIARQERVAYRDRRRRPAVRGPVDRQAAVRRQLDRTEVVEAWTR